MRMTIPALPKAGTYYLWPGLQDVGNTGVYQSVLDGRSGTWWLGSGWCCSNPELPWGNGTNVSPPSVAAITMTHDNANWSSTVTSGSSTTSNSFAIGTKNMSLAVLAIELHSVKWDFGALTWKDVVMVMNTTETDWCTNPPENLYSATKYTSTGDKAVVQGNQVNCFIDRIVMEGPAST